MSDKETNDSLFFEGMASTIFEESPNTDIGRQALLDAYNAYSWSDQEQARDALGFYGENLQYKNKDNYLLGPEIEKIAPVTLENIPITPEDSLQDIWSKWEESNTEYLSRPDLEPEYLVGKKQLLDTVKEYSSLQRRLLNTGRDIKDGKIVSDRDDTMADSVGRSAQDLGARILRGFTPGQMFDDYLTELTDPAKDGKILSALAEGVGQTSSFILGGAIPKIGAVAVGGIAAKQTWDITAERYEDTLKKTGDSGEALKAGAIELGSQSMQSFADTLVFGRVAKLLKGSAGTAAGEIAESTGSKVAKAAGTEFATESVGALISSTAENIEEGRPLTQDIFSGENLAEAGMEGAIAALMGGGAMYGSIKLPGGITWFGNRNSTARSVEIETDGTPVTPTKTQVIGAKFDAQPTDTDNDVNVIPPIEGTPAFTTEDGTVFNKTEEGQYFEAGTLPFQNTYFIPEEQAKGLAAQLLQGAQAVASAEGPVIETIDSDGNPITIPIEGATTTPTEGSYVLQADNEVTVNPDQHERPIHIGQRVKTVNTSMGAAGPDITLKESQYSQKLRDPRSTVPEGMAAVGKKGIFYQPKPDATVNEATNDFVLSNGIDKAIASLNDYSLPENIREGLPTYVHNFFMDALNVSMEKDAQEGVGLSDTTKDLLNKYEQVAPIISASGTDVSRMLRFRRNMRGLAPMYKARAYTKSFEDQTAAIATEEGVTPEELVESPKKIKELTESIQKVQDEVSADEASITPEAVMLDEEIGRIESEAQEALDTDLDTIEEESTAITQEVKRIERKARKTKDQDIKTLEKAVAVDSEALTNAMNDVQTLKELTEEEIAARDAEISEALQKSVDRTNTEVMNAVKAERKANQEAEVDRLTTAENRLTKADEALKATQKSVFEQMKKLKVRESNARAEGKPVDGIQKAMAAQEKKLVRAAERKAKAERALNELRTKTEEELAAEKEAEEIYQELESGIEVIVEPKGKKRGISVRTKKSGMNISKLFNKKSTAFEPLITLSRNVNALAEVFSKTKAIKEGSSELINELRRRIDENKKALNAVRTRDPLSPGDAKRIEAAKKRLAELAKAKEEATLESRIPGREKKRYAKYKERRKALEGVSPDTSEKRKLLYKLEADRRKAEKLAEKLKAARAKAREDADRVAKVQDSIESLEEYLETSKDLTPIERNAVERKLALLKTAGEYNPDTRDIWFRAFNAHLITGPGIIVGALSAALSPFGDVGRLALMSAEPLTYNFKTLFEDSNVPYKQVPLLNYLAGLKDLQAIARGLRLFKQAVWDGERVGPVINKRDLIALGDVSVVGTKAEQDSAHVFDKIRDYYLTTKSLKFKYEIYDPRNAPTLALKFSGIVAGNLLRVLTGIEAVQTSVFDQAHEYASAALYYNRAIDKGEVVTEKELKEFLYNSKARWEKAQLVADGKAKKLREAGVEYSAVKQYQSAVQEYFLDRPRAIQLSTYKRAMGATLNTPAPGYIGVATTLLDSVNSMLSGVPVLNKFRYMTPFANSIASLIGRMVEWTPFGFGVMIAPEKMNRTEYELAMVKSSAIISTAIMTALPLYVINQMLDVPEDERMLDIIGRYSKDNDKVNAFKENGGVTNSVAINISGKPGGRIFIPFPETEFGLMLSAIAGAIDLARDKKDPDADVTVGLTAAATAMAASLYGAAGSMSMLRGVTDLVGTIGAYLNGDEAAPARLTQLLANMGKSVVIPTSLFRAVARYTDNPIEARRDIVSAIVDGIPGVQSAFGRPQLNVFGEVKEDYAPGPLNLHRIFATEGVDTDIRWMNTLGYDMPQIPDMDFSDAIQNKYGKEWDRLNYEMKYDTYRKSSVELRSLIGSARERYGNTYNKHVHKYLREAWNRILAKNAWEVAAEYEAKDGPKKKSTLEMLLN